MTREQYSQRKAAGKCCYSVACERGVEVGRPYCEKHRRQKNKLDRKSPRKAPYHRAYNAETKLFAKANGLCREICGEHLTAEDRARGFTRCLGCRRRRRAFQEAYRKSDKGKQTRKRCMRALWDKRMRAGLCAEHGNERPCDRCVTASVGYRDRKRGGPVAATCAACGEVGHTKTSTRCRLRFSAGSIDEIATSRPWASY